MKILLSPCARSVLIVSTLLFSGNCTFAAEPSREVENWGTFEDPSERASLQVGEESVVITSEKNMLTIDNPLGKMPRITRDVKGNFDARVRISGDFVDEYQEAMVLAMIDQRNYLAISCGSGRYRVDEISTTIVVEGGLADHQFNRATNTTAWLRVRRKGDEIKSFYSFDGLHWIESASSSELASVSKPAVPGFTSPMQLMLTVHNGSKTPLDVTFNDFVVDELVVEDIETIEDPIDAKRESQRKRARTRGFQFILVSCGIASALALFFIWGCSRSQPFKQLIFVALWAIPIWAVTSALGWYGFQHSSFSMDPGSKAHPFVLLVLPVVITWFSLGLAFGTTNAIGMTIGFIVQYVACMPFGWFTRFCVHRIQELTQHQMPDLKDEKDRIE